eukprot:scaffold528288_cov18-Prasinocladus_malaysianus.AAC.1
MLETRAGGSVDAYGAMSEHTNSFSSANQGVAWYFVLDQSNGRYGHDCSPQNDWATLQTCISVYHIRMRKTN